MELLIVILLVLILINGLSIKSKLNELTGDSVNRASDWQTDEEQSEVGRFSPHLERHDEPQPIEPYHVVQQQVAEEPATQQPVSDIPPPIPEVSTEPSVVAEKMSELIQWLKKDWLAKSGALILLIGIGWFVSYAFAEGWVGEQGRITIGLLFGALMLVLGHWRISKSSIQGGLLLIIGSSTVLTTVWAAQNLYEMFPPLIALGIMFLSIVFVTFTSVLYRKQSLATVALLLGLVSPLLTNSPEPSFEGLFSYLLVLVLGTIWVVVKTGWKPLLLISLVAVFVYSLSFSINVPRDIAGIALLYAFVFSGIFTVVANLTLIRNGRAPEVIDLCIVSGVGLYLFTWIEGAAPGHWESVLYASWAIVFAGIGYVVFQLTKDLKNFLVYGTLALVYVVLATVATFDGPLLTISLTIEAAVVPVLVYTLTRRKELLVGLSLLMVVPVLLSLDSLASSGWNKGVPLDHLAVLVVVGASMLVLGLFTLKQGRKPENHELSNWGVTQATVSGLYGLSLIWLIPRGLFSPDYDTGKLISLVIYTIIGVTVYVVGHIRDQVKVRFVGGLLAGLVILRLLFVEVWDMEEGTRIVTFILIGFLLVATAFIEKKNKD